jgi:uncharacterized membrane protein YbhN (UPF0104 family)
MSILPIPEESSSAPPNGHRLRHLFAGLVLFACAWYAYAHFADFKSIRLVSGSAALVAAILVASTVFISSIQTISFFKIYGIHLGFIESIGLTTIGSVGNLIAPARSGTFSNAIYLKRVHGLAYGAYIGSLAATYFVTISVNCFLGAASLATTASSTPIHNLSIRLFLAGAFAALVALFAFPHIKLIPESRPLKFVVNALNSCGTLRKNFGHLAVQFACVLINALLQAGIIYFTLQAIGSDATLSASIFIGVVSSLSAIIAVTPGNLGLREIFAVLSGQLISLDGALLVAASILERGLLLICSGGMAFLFGRKLWNRLLSQPSSDTEA